MIHSVLRWTFSMVVGVCLPSLMVAEDWSTEKLAELGIDDKEPSLTEREKTATVGSLLKARSGIYHPALYETAAMAAKRPERGAHAPDTFWYYNNWDFNALATIFDQETVEEFEEKICRPLGLRDFKRRRDTRDVTGNDSVHRAYLFQLSTRDLARFGQLMLQNGRWNDKQIVPESWVRESTVSYSDVGSSGGYGYMWWVAAQGKHFPGVTLPEGSYSARGYRGQYLVVVPKWNLVVCHRVNTHQKGTVVSKTDFGKLLAMILAARPDSARLDAETPQASAPAADFDVVIRHGEIIDATERPRFRADIESNADRIAENERSAMQPTWSS
jgi:CubicO group peptidase (beta-lactamase class C family)